MPWFDTWNVGFWFLLPMLICVVMMVFMMGSHRIGGHHMSDRYLGHDDRASTDSALDILRQRFANGELTQLEYEEHKRALTT